MIASVLAAVVVGSPAIPQNVRVEYTGIPTLTRNGVPVPGVRVVTHSATAELIGDRVRFVSTTQFRNDTREPQPVDITIPRRGHAPLEVVPTRGRRPANLPATVVQPPLPNFGVVARWDQTALSLVPAGATRTTVGRDVSQHMTNDLRATATMVATGTHALRIETTVPVGSGGLDGKMRFVGYLDSQTTPIGQYNFAFRYPQEGSVFGLPSISFDERRWQVGDRGAFIQRNNYTPANSVILFSFYPGGFDPIGR
ncbi:MAG: hypothetical protein SNJ74_03885 [Fimbriimonadaceae bacterium]